MCAHHPVPLTYYIIWYIIIKGVSMKIFIGVIMILLGLALNIHSALAVNESAFEALTGLASFVVGGVLIFQSSRR